MLVTLVHNAIMYLELSMQGSLGLFRGEKKSLGGGGHSYKCLLLFTWCRPKMPCLGVWVLQPLNQGSVEGFVTRQMR